MSDFQNNPISQTDLPDFAEVDLQPVSPQYLKVVMFNTFVFSVFLLAGAFAGYFFFLQQFPYSSTPVFIAVIVLIILLFISRYFSFFQRKYAVREKDIIYHFGLIRRNMIITPFSRIQHTSIEEGWISRMLGLKSVTFYTAGSSGSDLQISGLPKETAERLNQLVMNKISEEALAVPDEINSAEESSAENPDQFAAQNSSTDAE